jgi:hypothetical protein
MRISIVLLVLALIGSTIVGIVQNAAITKATVTIRQMSENPNCMIGPVWRGKTSQHKRRVVSDN